MRTPFLESAPITGGAVGGFGHSAQNL
jgi:hypothetical protein